MCVEHVRSRRRPCNHVAVHKASWPSHIHTSHQQPVQATMRSAAPAETSGRSFECSYNCFWSPACLQLTAGLRQRDRSVRIVPAAESRSSRNGTDSSDLARMETAVPVDQRPATQLKELRDSQLYSWVGISGYAAQPSCALSLYFVQEVRTCPRAFMSLQATLERDAYLKRLGFLFTSSFCLLGGPIAYQTFDPFGQVIESPCRSYDLACCMPASSQFFNAVTCMPCVRTELHILGRRQQSSF